MSIQSGLARLAARAGLFTTGLTALFAAWNVLPEARYSGHYWGPAILLVVSAMAFALLAHTVPRDPEVKP